MEIEIAPSLAPRRTNDKNVKNNQIWSQKEICLTTAGILDIYRILNTYNKYFKTL